MITQQHLERFFIHRGEFKGKAATMVLIPFEVLKMCLDRFEKNAGKKKAPLD
jgi:hypothetical protein